MIGSAIILLFIILIRILGASKTFCIFIIYNFIDYGLVISGALQYKDIILLIFLFLLFFKNRLRTWRKYPFLLCSLLSIISYFLSTYFSSTPHWPFTILKCLRYFGIPLCFYYYVVNSCHLKMVQYFIKCMLYFSFFVVLYALMEHIIGTSPIVNFINDHNGAGYNLDEVFRYGIKRVQTVFIHATGLGFYCVVFTSFLLLFINKNVRKHLRIKQLNYQIVIIGLIITAFLSGTRSVLIPLPFILIYYLRDRIFKLKYFLGFICFSGLMVFLAKTYAEAYFDGVIDSILNMNDASVGSTTDMRDRQFEIAFLYWSSAPIIGHGSGYTFETVTPMNPDMYGAESIWMPLLIDNGILGALAYFLCYIAWWKYLKQYHEPLNSMIFLLVILFINTATSTPGVDISFNFILVMGISALAKVSTKTTTCRNHENFSHHPGIQYRRLY